MTNSTPARRWLTAVLTVPVLAACSGDSAGPDTDIPAELVGEWVAEPACAPPCAFTLAWTQNPAARVNAVTALGVTVRIDVTAAGRFTRSGSGDAASGSLEVDGSMLVVTDSRGVVDTIDYAIEGQYLNLAFRRDFVALDFNQDGQLDASRVTGVFRKR